MHDRNGNQLKKGDRVMVEAVITELYPTADFCNVTVKTVAGRRPDGNKEMISSINTGVLTLLESAKS